MEEQSSTPGEGSSSNTTTKKQRNYLGSGKPRRGRPRSRQPPRRLPAVQPEVQSPPCTDYDRAYFKYYSHVGVHEEMLKVYTATIITYSSDYCYALLIFCMYLFDSGCFIECSGILMVYCTVTIIVYIFDYCVALFVCSLLFRMPNCVHEVI
ncbi:hypothetical protein Hanom_Chr16g01502851 [Helianthus anomalus]